jgi:hypothetical protein
MDFLKESPFIKKLKLQFTYSFFPLLVELLPDFDESAIEPLIEVSASILRIL